MWRIESALARCGGSATLWAFFENESVPCCGSKSAMIEREPINFAGIMVKLQNGVVVPNNFTTLRNVGEEAARSNPVAFVARSPR
jgi:hypothetical protein